MCASELWHRAHERVPCERSPIGSPVERALIRPRRPKAQTRPSTRRVCASLRVRVSVCVCVRDTAGVGDTIKLTAFEIYPTSYGVKKKTCSEWKYVSWIPSLLYDLT